MTLPDWVNEGRKTFRSYQSAPLVTKEIEDAFVQIFEQINTELQVYYPRHTLLHIVRFPEDAKDFRCLPQILTVYRGYREPEKRLGISWSLSRRIAEGFSYNARVPRVTGERIVTINGKTYTASKKYSSEEEAQLLPMLITGTCNLQDVLAYTNLCREQEIVINPTKISNVQNIAPSEAGRKMIEALRERIRREGNKAMRIEAEPLEWLQNTRQH